jgi:hypothetical protein
LFDNRPRNLFNQTEKKPSPKSDRLLEEAVSGLGRWVDLAIAGEDIRIRKGDPVVELRPVGPLAAASPNEPLAPREALRRLQAEARLTPDQAQQCLNAVYDERLAAEARQPA